MIYMDLRFTWCYCTAHSTCCCTYVRTNAIDVVVNLSFGEKAQTKSRWLLVSVVVLKQFSSLQNQNNFNSCGCVFTRRHRLCNLCAHFYFARWQNQNQKIETNEISHRTRLISFTSDYCINRRSVFRCDTEWLIRFRLIIWGQNDNDFVGHKICVLIKFFEWTQKRIWIQLLIP